MRISIDAEWFPLINYASIIYVTRLSCKYVNLTHFTSLYNMISKIELKKKPLFLAPIYIQQKDLTPPIWEHCCTLSIIQYQISVYNFYFFATYFAIKCCWKDTKSSIIQSVVHKKSPNASHGRKKWVTEIITFIYVHQIASQLDMPLQSILF